MRRPAMAPVLVLAVLAIAVATAAAVDGDVKCAECGTGTVPAALPPPPPYYYYSPPPPAPSSYGYPGVSNYQPPPGGYIAIGGSPPGRMYPQDPGFMPSNAPPRPGSFAAVPFTVCALAALAALRAFW